MIRSTIVDMERLRDLESKKLISIQKHPTDDLFIHNYTQVCQFGKQWDELSLQCRGLITTASGKIISRPFCKFFNVSEHEGHQVSEHEGFKLPAINWNQMFTATKKMDGSLGILYFSGGYPQIATRGSFVSDQAKRGTDIFYRKGYDRFLYPRDLTFLFEIIYPENRIVLDYGDMEELVLLEVIETETGRAKSWEMVKNFATSIRCPVVDHIPVTAEMLQKCASDNVENEEGYVIRFNDGMRVKVKFEEYCRLHKLVTGITSRKIWECLMNGNDLKDILDRVPDEFFDWVTKTRGELTGKFSEIRSDCETYFLDIKKKYGHDRKTFAEHARKHAYPSVMFSLLDGKDPSQIIWKAIRPVSTSPFKNDPDA